MLHLLIDHLRLSKIEELGKLEMHSDAEDNLAVLSKISHENHQGLLKAHLVAVYEQVSYPVGRLAPLEFNFFSRDFSFPVMVSLT